MSTQAERIARLEQRMDSLEKKMDGIDKKLDDLLTLKNKGAGAFWLVSMIVTSVIFAYGVGVFKGMFIK